LKPLQGVGTGGGAGSPPTRGRGLKPQKDCNKPGFSGRPPRGGVD